MCRENHSGLPGTRQQDSLAVDKLCGSLILSWSPQTSQRHTSLGWLGRVHGELRLICTGLFRLGLGRQEVYLEVRLWSNCLRILVAPCPNTLHLGSEAAPHARPGWPSKATSSSQLSTESRHQSSETCNAVHAVSRQDSGSEVLAWMPGRVLSC